MSRTWFTASSVLVGQIATVEAQNRGEAAQGEAFGVPIMDSDKIDPAQAVARVGTVVERPRALAAAFSAADGEAGLFGSHMTALGRSRPSLPLQPAQQPPDPEFRSGATHVGELAVCGAVAADAKRLHEDLAAGGALPHGERLTRTAC